MKHKLILLLFISTILQLKAQDTLLNTLSKYLNEYRIEAKKENGKLWGISFDVPILISTHKFLVTNRPVDDLKPYKNIFYAKSDENIGGGNSTKIWKGKNWAFYTYSESSFNNKKDRLSLFFHKAYHYNQPLLDLNGEWTQCKHLNETDARLLLKLEYNALLKALKEKDFITYLTDALTFRAYRYCLYPNAYNEEQTMEMLEGLANYTELKLVEHSANEI